jgi:hypothetical protein
MDETPNAESFSYPYDTIIGKQAEVCFEYYLKHSKRYKLIAANIQINGEKETLGEIDYLVFDIEAQKTLHIELACKFYLYDSDLKEPSVNKWIGPNRKDTLKEKLDKLQNKQFPLLRKTETQDILKKLNIDANIFRQQLCLKAFLFLRKGISINRFSENYQACVVGYWIPFSEFISEDTDGKYAIPKKKEWLLPLENMEDWVNFAEALTIISLQIDTKKSTLVYKKTNSIISRFFVVWW